MLELDRELFDEYKRLDSICRDMFSSQRGVSEYIEQMERTSSPQSGRVRSWNEDYRTLKRLRWLRNQIAHETCASECSEEDIARLEDFYSRILRQQDPLAVLRRLEREELERSRRARPAEKVRTHTVEEQLPPNNMPRLSEKRKSRGLVVLLCSVAVAAFVLLMWILFGPRWIGRNF